MTAGLINICYQIGFQNFLEIRRARFGYAA